MRLSFGLSPEASSRVSRQGGVAAVGIALHMDILRVLIALAGGIFFPAAAFPLETVYMGAGVFNSFFDILGSWLHGADRPGGYAGNRDGRSTEQREQNHGCRSGLKP